jgi:hypothetical protein
MIDIENEEVLSLAQAARWLPNIRGARATGKGVHPVTIWRWTRYGVAGLDGQKVVLESIKLGGTRCTSIEAVQRFIGCLQGAAVPPVSRQPRAEAKRAAKAMEELRKLGFCI